jgi:preprotein translocase subunit SecA
MLTMRWAESIRQREFEYKELSDLQIRQLAKQVELQILTGADLNVWLPKVFVLAGEVTRRELGVTLRTVQYFGACVLSQPFIAEMQTGEGKTYTAIGAIAARALARRGCHVFTANEYLASRDAESLRPVFARLGLTTSCVLSTSSDDERKFAYKSDIVYTTVSEAGFDYLRDRAKLGPRVSVATGSGLHFDAGCVHRELFAAVVDEADSVMIDDASTPLVLGIESAPSEASSVLFKKANHTATMLKNHVDFAIDSEQRSAWLTESGKLKAILMMQSANLRNFSNERQLVAIEKAIIAHHCYDVNKDYLIEDGQIVLVSDSTGRRMVGRKWQDGLHQAIEAKERIDFSSGTSTLAKITIQRFLRKYRFLSGMTGTAVQSRQEFKKFYGLKIKTISTHSACIRKSFPPLVYSDRESMNVAAVAEAIAVSKSGRPVLLGTPSVEASLQLSQLLQERDINHFVLNAIQDETEAQIVGQAGHEGSITVATNMAGRGTDIILSERVKELGGLHVISTSLNHSRRIDRQLIGRSARQGDPGSYRFICSVEDAAQKYPHSRLIGLIRNIVDRSDAKGETKSNTKDNRLPQWVFIALRWLQRSGERQNEFLRRLMYKQDLEQSKKMARSGLDLDLESTWSED